MYDLVIRGATIVDGTGAAPRNGDVAVEDDAIAAIGKVDGPGRREIDADGAMVTPGWIDIHTHYDGQVTWDDELAPSSMNGVTTAVMGNCGVGFAPVAPGTEQTLVELMEGVEDIPGAALYEGIPWGQWESFGEYLDVLAARSYTFDVAAQIPHGAVRFYVMGERGAKNEDATAEEVELQARLVGEALIDGAVGFTSSRTIGHRALWGNPVPGTFAAEDELLAIAEVMQATGKGVFEVITASTVGPLDNLGGERSTQLEEIEMLGRFSQASGRPVTFTLTETSESGELWRAALDRTAELNAAGARLYPQVAARPISVLTGLSSYHAFMRKPTYIEHLADLPLDERVATMRDPDIRHALMTERSVAPDAPGSMDNLYGLLKQAAANTVPMTDPVRYEPEAIEPLGTKASAQGREPLEALYDFLLEDDGTVFGRIARDDPATRMNVIEQMLTHPTTVTGLSDAGAHVTMICDGTMPTTQLIYWTRDRNDGPRLPVEFVVHKQTARNAELYGFGDRGTIEVGRRADLNVIDYENLSTAPPVSHHDLPAGGTRLIQPVTGYLATVCAGQVTRENDSDTGKRPGALVRG